MGSSDDSIEQLFRGGGIDFLGTMGSFAILYLAKAVLTRHLEIADFGTLTLGMTVLTILSTVSLLGLKSGVSRFIPRMENQARKRDVALTGLGLGFTFSLLSGTVLFVSAPALSIFLDGENIVEVLRAFAFALPLYAVLRLSVGITLGYERVVPKILTKEISLPISRLGAIVVVTILSLGSVAAAWGYVVSFGVAAVVGVVFLFRTVDLQDDKPFRPNAKELLKFSAPLAVSGSVSMILSDIDTLILGSIATASAVGLYEVAYSLGSLFTIVVSSLGAIFVPMMSRLHGEGAFEEMQHTYFRSNKWTAGITLPPLLVTLTYPDTIIALTFGAKYASATAALIVLALGFSAHAILGPNGGFMISIGATREVLYGNVLVSSVNLVLNFALIPAYGPLGAAVATTISYVILNIIYQVFIYHRTGIVPIDKDVLRTWAISIVSYLPVMIIFEAISTPSVPTILVLSGTYAVICAIAQVRAGFVTESEQVIIESLEKKLGVPIGEVIRRIES